LKYSFVIKEVKRFHNKYAIITVRTSLDNIVFVYMMLCVELPMKTKWNQSQVQQSLSKALTSIR